MSHEKSEARPKARHSKALDLHGTPQKPREKESFWRKRRRGQSAESISTAPFRLVSPLMIRVMAVNVIALLALIGGIFYLANYRSSLIEARQREIEIQAEIIAGALGEALGESLEGSLESALGGEVQIAEIDLAIARQILIRLVGPTSYRARLFAPDGRLLTDSRFLSGEKKILEERLPDLLQKPSYLADFEQRLFDFLDQFTKNIYAPPDIDRLGLRAEDLSEVVEALSGEKHSQIRARSDGQLVVNVAVPVQQFRRVLGVLLFSAPTSDIDTIVREEKRLTLRVFASVLAITLLMSFFLSRTLLRPIRILVRAAERVRRGIGREESLPEFATRRDEIGDLSRALSAMTRALYNQIDAVERFAADVSHELKNPITSMLSAIETLERVNKPDIQARLMAILKEDIKRLERLITDVSNASRLDAELTRGAMRGLDLGLAIDQVIEGYHTIGLPRDIILSYKQPVQGSVMVSGLEGRLSQVWRNLIDNAISFSPDGGVITVRLEKRGRFVEIHIEDEGPGLPFGAAEKIFKRFYSERPDHEAFGSHSGLGLAISKQIVEAHGGRIIADNRIKKAAHKSESAEVIGASFKVWLPLWGGR